MSEEVKSKAATYLVVFEDPERAKIFAIRLALNLRDIAIYRDNLAVYVIDGADPEQGDRIRRLVRGSSGTLMAVGREATKPR